jgi:prepilin-type N-terminal cleavage/methylation domain-containing protein
MFKSNKGVTLIELLAALSLLSIIIVLASSLQIFSQKQTKNQTTEIQNQSNLRLAINVITKEIRSADSVKVPNNNQLEIYKMSSKYVYKFENNTLKKDDQPLIPDLQLCTFIPYPNNTSIDYITITITSKSVPASTLKTTIYLRK